MTEFEARGLYVNTVKSYLNFSEASGKHRQIIDLYNSMSPLPRGYRVTYTDAWCATFVSAMAIKCKMTDIIPRECGCYYQVEAFKKMNRWMENDAYCPQAGDIIYYDWQDSGVGDNSGVPDHVGIVCSVSEDNTITVIEGNYSDTVKYRYIKVNARNIRGYGLPDYAKWAKAHTTSNDKEDKDVVRYNKVSEMPEYYRKDIQKLIDMGIIRGRENGLDLSEDMVRMAIYMGRMHGILN